MPNRRHNQRRSGNSGRGVRRGGVVHFTYSGRGHMFDVYSNNTIYSALATPGSTSPALSTILGLSLFDGFTRAQAPLWTEWRLDRFRLSFAPSSNGSGSMFAIGYVADPQVVLPSQNSGSADLIYSTFNGSKMVAADTIATGSGLVHFDAKLEHKWLYTTNAGQTTGASYRQTTPGAIFAAWDTIPAATRVGSLLAEYTISFRGPVYSNTINLSLNDPSETLQKGTQFDQARQLTSCPVAPPADAVGKRDNIQWQVVSQDDAALLMPRVTSDRSDVGSRPIDPEYLTRERHRNVIQQRACASSVEPVMMPTPQRGLR